MCVEERVGLCAWRSVLNCVRGGVCWIVCVEERVGLCAWRSVLDCVRGGVCRIVSRILNVDRQVVPCHSTRVNTITGTCCWLIARLRTTTNGPWCNLLSLPHLGRYTFVLIAGAYYKHRCLSSQPTVILYGYPFSGCHVTLNSLQRVAEVELLPRVSQQSLCALTSVLLRDDVA